MCLSAKQQRTSRKLQFWGPSRQQAGDSYTLSGWKPRKYKPGTTQYHHGNCVRKYLYKKAVRSLPPFGPSDPSAWRC